MDVGKYNSSSFNVNLKKQLLIQTNIQQHRETFFKLGSISLNYKIQLHKRTLVINIEIKQRSDVIWKPQDSLLFKCNDSTLRQNINSLTKLKT